VQIVKTTIKGNNKLHVSRSFDSATVTTRRKVTNEKRDNTYARYRVCQISQATLYLFTEHS